MFPTLKAGRLIGVLFFFYALLLNGQSSFIPQNLGPSVNSEYDEINPVISPDGKTLYFVRVNHPANKYGEFDSQDIWYSELVDGKWKEAKRLEELNIGRYNAILAMMDGGKTVLVNGVFNKNGTFYKKRGLSISTISNLVWTPPVNLKIKKLSKMNDGAISSASISADGKAIYFSMSRMYNAKKSDIFFTEKNANGKWRKPKRIHELSSGGSDESPFIAPDNKTLYLASDEAGKNQFDIYRTSRDPKNQHDWLVPVRLSDTINSKGWENYFKTTSSGSYAFFSSTNNSIGGADIYKVKLFEENPFVIVSGKVINEKTGNPLGKPFTIMANGRQADSVHINTDSSTYRLKLPLKNKYDLLATVTNYTSTKTEVDVSKEREFTTVKKDLLVKPYPYVHVEGNVLNRQNNKPVAAEIDTRILLNNASSDSIRFDRTTGHYSMNIPHGAKYSLVAKAPKFESNPSELDLSLVNEYKEITLDLYLDIERAIIVTGTVLNKKTNGRFIPSSKVQVVFNEVPTLPTFDTLTCRYTIVLLPGKVYAITASAPNCLPAYESVDLTTIAKGSTVTKDIALAPIEVGQAVRLNNIFFESGKAVLKKESFPELDRVADFLSKNPSIKIEIAGHTDNVGNAAFNLALSKSRAESVANYLAKKGIDKARLKSNGYGMNKPVSSNTTNAGRANNRRVEFVVLDK